ncbi:hypothetical protein EI94DRAFT_1812844 [Lactarius quietus]|nr:hypothetical protein EI94DRAFT_1812844 [Lactarius quietus]
MPSSSQPVDQVPNPAIVGSRCKYLVISVRRSSDIKHTASCSSKTKALRDTLWHHLKPRTYLKSLALAPKTQKNATKPAKKKLRLTSGETSDVVPRLHARPLGSNNPATRKDLPLMARQKLALHKGSSDQSSQEDELQSSQDNESPNEDLLTLDNNNIALTFDNETVQWDRATVQGTPSQRVSQHSSKCIRPSDPADSEHGAGCEAASCHEDSALETSTLTDEIRAEPTRRRRILTHHARLRQEELLEISDNDVKDDGKSNKEEHDPNCPSFFGPHNRGWRCAPFFAPGKGQRNLCINAQPPNLKDILKEAIRVLHHNCTFKHGYIPVDSQMDCLIHILIEAATKLNRGDYTLRAQTDAILQRTASDLLITRVSLYRTNIKHIASGYVAHGYGLKDSKPEQDVQVASLLTNDRFIFEPREDGINPAKLFHHPVIIQTIQEAFFK